MHVCMYVCMYILCVGVCTMCVCMCMLCTYVCVCYVRMYVLYVRMFVCMYVRTYVRMCIYIMMSTRAPTYNRPTLCNTFKSQMCRPFALFVLSSAIHIGSCSKGIYATLSVVWCKCVISTVFCEFTLSRSLVYKFPLSCEILLYFKL